MRTARVVLASAGLVVLAAGFAAAHHSAIAFDFRKWATVEGVVKQFEVTNPHAEIVLTVTDAKGTRDIAFEGHSRNNFYRAGWRADMIKPGDKIKVTFAVRRDGQDGGFVNSFISAQGKEVGFQLAGAGAAPAAANTPQSGAK